MPTYVFKGRNRLNEIVVGERVADNREALRQILRKEQVTLTSVKEKGREIGIPKIGRRKKVKSKDLSVFTRQFSVMIDAGLPLVQCLEILAQQQDNKYFQQILLHEELGKATNGLWTLVWSASLPLKHGTSEQRVRWFKRGFETGDLRQGDTFSAEVL